MGVGRILDMCHTVINVSGDLVTAKLKDVWVGGQLSQGEEVAAELDRARSESDEGVLTIE